MWSKQVYEISFYNWKWKIEYFAKICNLMHVFVLNSAIAWLMEALSFEENWRAIVYGILMFLYRFGHHLQTQGLVLHRFLH